MKYYLIGIKGSGMSALASLLFDLGHYVIGSDVSSNYGFEEGLIKRNLKMLEFSEKNITNEYIYIISSAYDKTNEEVNAVMKNNYEHYYYHEFISKLKGIHIAVSGTHGKTTTTTFIKDLLINEKIGYIIGDGTGGGCPDYKYLIYEACEYKDHFLKYNPDILVITNIDFDHPDYFKNLNDVKQSFNRLKQKSKKVIEIRKDEYTILEVKNNSTLVKYFDDVYNLNLVGNHLVEDFILAVKVLNTLGFDSEYIKENISNIKMPKRRSEEYKIKNTIIIEDYGHHPTEIQALHNMIEQKYKGIHTICLFQPHTYSRTLALYKAFIDSLLLYDEVYIDEVFTSKREPYNIYIQNKINYLFNMFNSYKEFNTKYINFEKEQIIILLGAGDLHIRFKENLQNEKE